MRSEVMCGWSENSHKSQVDMGTALLCMERNLYVPDIKMTSSWLLVCLNSRDIQNELMILNFKGYLSTNLGSMIGYMCRRNFTYNTTRYGIAAGFSAIVFVCYDVNKHTCLLTN